MALPTLHRKLFRNDGYGPLLRPEIIPLASDPDSAAADEAASPSWVRAYAAQWLASDVVAPSAVYVDPVNGDDSNDGLTAATAFKTVSHACAVVGAAGKIASGYSVVYLAAGTYNEGLFTSEQTGDIAYVGPSSGYATVTAIQAYNNEVMRLGGNIRCTGGIQVSRSGVLRLSDGLNLNFNNWSGLQAFYVFQGGHVYVVSGSTVNISFTGTCSVSNATVRLANFSEFNSYGTINWSGSVTGSRYSLYRMCLTRGMGGVNAIPGTVAGGADETSTYN